MTNVMKIFGSSSFLAFVFFAPPAMSQENPPAPTIADMRAALIEANAQAGSLANRAQTLAANLAHANDEIGALKAQLAKAKPTEPATKPPEGQAPAK